MLVYSSRTSGWMEVARKGGQERGKGARNLRGKADTWSLDSRTKRYRLKQQYEEGEEAEAEDEAEDEAEIN